MSSKGNVLFGVAACVALVLMTTGATAQPSTARVSGIVRDAAGTAIEGVQVTLVGANTNNKSATSDSRGRFEIEAVTPGRYELKTTGSHLRDASETLQIQPGARVEIAVEVQRIHSETVIVTAARGEQSVVGSPASVSVIDSTDIESSPAASVPELLQQVPGLNIVQFNARDFEINSRSSSGILANSTLVLVDGRSFFQPLYGAVYWDLMTVPTDQIAQIEVMRSPASAVWGANAMNGVVNIRTRSPRQMTGLRGQIGFGNQGTKMGDVSWAAANDGFSYKLSASYFEQDAWPRDNVLPDGSPMPAAVTFTNRGTQQPKFDARIDWDRDPRRVWSVRGGLAGAYGLIHSALGPGEFDTSSYASYLEVDRHTDDFDVKVYWNRLDAPFEIVLYGLPEHATNDTFVGDVTKQLRIHPRHTLTFGGSVRSDRFDVSIAPADTHRIEGGAFVEDTANINSWLSVMAGGRLDKFDTTSAVFAPRVGGVVTVSPGHSIRAAYNRAYRAPSLLENFIDVTLPAVVPLDPPFVYAQLSTGSTTLKMEKQDAFEIGYTGLLGAHATVFATGYTQRITDNIWFLPVAFYGPDAPPPNWPLDPAFVPPLPKTYTFRNLGHLRDSGVELAAHVDVAPFAIHASYTFQGVPSFDDGLPGIDLPINRPSRHQDGVTVTYRERAFTAEGSVRYVTPAFWADVFTQPFWGYTDSYHSIDGRVSYRGPNRAWELWASATNLSNQAIKTHVYGDTIGRTVMGGLRWQLANGRLP